MRKVTMGKLLLSLADEVKKLSLVGGAGVSFLMGYSFCGPIGDRMAIGVIVIAFWVVVEVFSHILFIFGTEMIAASENEGHHD